MRAFLKIIRWPALALLTTSLIAGVVIALNPTWIKVEQIELELAPTSTEDLLFQRIKASLVQQTGRMEGSYFWKVPLSGVYEMAMKDRRVKKVTVHREFPSRMKVEIEPHTPVLAYLGGDGRLYPVALDATMLPALAASDAADLPLLRGEDLKDEPSLRELAIELFERIPADGPLNKKQISEISYTKKDGFQFFVSGFGSDIKIGDTDFGPKLSRVTKVLSYLESQNIKGRVIDARFSKKVLVRVRNTP